MVSATAYEAAAAAGGDTELAEGALHLIDFEYGGKNYTGFDVRRHTAAPNLPPRSRVAHHPSAHPRQQHAQSRAVCLAAAD